MTAAEFLVARKALGLTQEEMAGDLGLTPHVIAGIENGEARVPKSIARELDWRVAVAKRDAVLAASGLPECAVALKLESAMEGKSGDDMMKAVEALVAHVKDCPTCKARDEYAQAHAPAIPELPMPGWVRGLGLIEGLLERLPPPFRPSDGEKGKGRRIGVSMAAFFSLIAIAIGTFGAIAGLANNGFASSWWQQPLGIIVAVPLAYFVGFFLAGTVYDLTRPIARRFLGYVLRGLLIVPAIYGSVGFVLPFFDDKMHWSEWPYITLGFAIIGGVGGGLLWIVDRIRGKLPAATA